MTIELGLAGTAEMTVDTADTASSLGTGDVDALATPRLLQLMQQATMAALDGHVTDGMITAVMRVNVDHLSGSPVGADVTATATLIRIEGRRLVFEAEAVSDGITVGMGRIIRVQIDRDSFLSRVQ